MRGDTAFSSQLTYPEVPVGHAGFKLLEPLPSKGRDQRHVPPHLVMTSVFSARLH